MVWFVGKLLYWINWGIIAERRVTLQCLHDPNPRTCLTKTKDMYNNDPALLWWYCSGCHVGFFRTKLDTKMYCIVSCVCNEDKSAFFFCFVLFSFPSTVCGIFFYLSRRPAFTPLAASGERENKLTGYDPPQKLNIDLATCNQIHTRQNGNKQRHVRVVAGHKT